MVDVFISYQRAEREAVQIIANKLVELRVSIWFDAKLRPGGSFDEEIATAIKEAKAVLTCWTPAALASEWVRGEATMARQDDRLVACFLEPTTLIPPFNLTHAEDLSAWAGQEDNPAWIKLLERIGGLIGRPGLAGFYAVMRPEATVDEIKAWADANGADPLADVVWTRLTKLVDEDQQTRFAREKQEAFVRDQRRKALEARSRQLIRDRGLRDPKREHRRWLILMGVVVTIGLVSMLGFTYMLDAQDRQQHLRDEANTPKAVRAFIAKNNWHPIVTTARTKLDLLDAEAWRQAVTAGSIEALQAYIDEASQEPKGQFLMQASNAVKRANDIVSMQEALKRLRLYFGPVHGALDTTTREAVKRFRYRWMLSVSDEVEDQDLPILLQQLDKALQDWINPRLDELMVKNSTPPTDEDHLRIAQSLKIDAAALQTIIEVEAPVITRKVALDGRPFIIYDREIFSRITGHKYDESNPVVSNPTHDFKNQTLDQKIQWNLLAEAYGLDRDAALSATEWGIFTILGSNFKSSGFQTVGEFVRFISESEANQLEAVLLGFVRGHKLEDALKSHDWESFARKYIGPGGLGNYVGRLTRAYTNQLARKPGIYEQNENTDEIHPDKQ